MMKAYISEYKKPEQFSSQGVPLTPEEYRDKVIEVYSNLIVQNEIHGLLNEYAEKAIVTAKTLEELAFVRGAIDALKELLKRKDTKGKKVNVV